jgi:NAD(P)-dependent dehydrogenase (short-subunit alcohol dehydrogenase family)
VTPLVPDTIPRAALLAGGSQPLVTAIGQALAGAGFAVAIQCHADAAEDLPDGMLALPADLTDEAQTAALVRRATEALGPIGVLVNCAGTVQRDSWDDATRATWDMHIETNLRAPFVLIQHFASTLPASSEGVVINLLDQRIHAHLVSYTLSKAALWTLTQTMALALAPRIRVNGIAPGPTLGQTLKPPRDRSSHADGGTRPEEVAQAALAILALRSMTGQMIVPDGAPRPAREE